MRSRTATQSADGRDDVERGTPKAGHTHGILAASSILAALGALSCCVVPFALFVLGISGAWIGNLTALQPYQPWFAAVAVASIGTGFYVVYRGRKRVCDDGPCASPRSIRLTKLGLWVATVLVVIAIGFPKLAPLFL